MVRDGTITRRRAIELASAGAAAGLAGCFGGNADQAQEQSPGDREPVHVLTDYSNEDWQELWENQIVPPFQEETGIEVNVEFSGFQGTGESRLATLIQSGDPPETFTGGLTQVGDLFESGQLRKVTDTVDAITSNAGDLIGEPIIIDGDQYLVPHGEYSSTIHHRTDVYDRLSLSVPKTWDDLYENAEAIENDDTDMRGMAVAGAKTGQSEVMFESTLGSTGHWLWQWKSDAREEAVVDFPENEAVEALEFMNQLAEFSMDPTSVNWSPNLKMWASERMGQMYFLNAWGAGVASKIGNDTVATNTDIANFPVRKGVSDPIRNLPGFDGYPILTGGGNADGMARLLEWMYDSPERAAQYYIIEPTRFIPAYQGVLESETYRTADAFQKYDGYLLELNEKVARDVSPKTTSTDRVPYTPATIYANSFPIPATMVNEVLVANRPPKAAYRDARDRLEQRLEEGKQRAG